ncbi:EVI2A protein, partial [Syrrhaptes paradoxus]|nr:EVI2A protein [Syrrhaptes paradoxus]
MQTKRRSNPHFPFPALMIFSLCLQTSANQTHYPGVTNGTWNPTSHNLPGSQNTTEAHTNPPLSIDFNSRTTASAMQTSSLQPSPSATAQSPTPSPTRRAAPAAGPRNSSKPQSTTTRETCEDNKSLLLICFVIIAVLVLICTFLFLSTVIIANKMAYLKKTKQGKRRPRSNGDILATTSLWPTAAGTWQRMPKVTAGAEMIMQDLGSGRDAATQRKAKDESTEKLTKETEDEQPHKPILTNFVIEI